MTPDMLLAAGYEKAKNPVKAESMGDWYRGSYEKRIIDEIGICYCIMVDHSIIPPRFADDHAVHMFSFNNQFADDGLVFNVQVLHDEESIERVERFFADLWGRMHLDHYKVDE